MRLTVFESHTYITQALQRQGAFRKDYQFPAAIDFALNKATYRFIRNGIKPIANTLRFQVNESSREDLQSLIVTNYPLTMIQSIDSGRYFRSPLPADFSYLINDRSVPIEDCEDAFTGATENRTYKYHYFDLADGTLDGNGYVYKQIVLTAGNQTVTLNHQGFTSVKDKVLLIDVIKYEFKKLGIDVYWENYYGIEKTNKFIIPSTNLLTVYSITIDGVALPLTNETKSYTDLVKLNLTASKLIANTNVKQDDVDNMVDSFYSRPRITNPLSTVASNVIEVYSDKKFLVSKLLIDYIRLPRPISLSLNYSSDLHHTAIDKVCDLAVEILKEQTENQSLDKTIQYNQLRNN
jgi:hypothetical protein